MSMLPKVNVRTADSRCANVHQTLVGTQLGDFAFHYPEVMVGVGVNSEVLGLLLDDCHFVRLSFLNYY